MREATGNALLTTIVTSMITIIMIFFVGSLSYSKSYRIKNHIIDEIEDNGSWNDSVQTETEEYLKDVGYNIKKGTYTCPNVTTNVNNCGNTNLYTGNYDLCIYRCGSSEEPYYKVVTFTRFEFPIIGQAVKFTIKGDTMIFNTFN